ncbi:MAG TPA: hypothetical protein VFR07_08430 [Mycobacteriales bacterium]|nr:hypothetical protein [Mycobacteriales bacterium]
MNAASADLSRLPGAPESLLDRAAAARLPAGTPLPPWACRVEGVLWWHRAPARAALPHTALAGTGARPYVVGALLHYLDSPVGPYREVLAGVVGRAGLLPGVGIPFIAVDSPASVQGGRAHWALPKVLATFCGPDPFGATQAEGDGWQLAAHPRPRGPRLPVAGRLRGRQRDAAGRPVGSTSTAYGTARPARVDVRVDSALAGEPGSIAGWLLSGRHPGALLRARLRVSC